jgi:hypothetical protein
MNVSDELTSLLKKNEGSEVKNNTSTSSSFLAFYVRTKDFYKKTVLQQDMEDDGVTLGIKRFTLLNCVTLFCWMISFVLIMTQIMDQERFSPYNWILFIPMWIGTFLGFIGGIAVALKVCRNAVLVSRERRLFLSFKKADFEESVRSTVSDNETPVGIRNKKNYVEFQSLPLMRRFFCWSLVLSVTYFILFAGQILYYLWFINMIRIWDSIFFIAFIVIIYLFYMYSVKIFSLLMCFVFSMLALQLVSSVSSFSYALFLLSFSRTFSYSLSGFVRAEGKWRYNNYMELAFITSFY